MQRIVQKNIIEKVINQYEQIEAEIAKRSQFLQQLRLKGLPVAALVSYLEDVTYMVGYTHVYCADAEALARKSGRKGLADFCHEKGIEEEGHNLWGKSDLEGFSEREKVPLRGGPSSGCIKMRDLVADLIVKNPANYLSYLYFTEKVTASMGPEFVELVFKSLGITKEQISVISKHVEVDQDHSGENEEIFGSLLDPNEIDDFVHNLGLIGERFIVMLDGHVQV